MVGVVNHLGLMFILEECVELPPLECGASLIFFAHGKDFGMQSSTLCW